MRKLAGGGTPGRPWGVRTGGIGAFGLLGRPVDKEGPGSLVRVLAFSGFAMFRLT